MFNSISEIKKSDYLNNKGKSSLQLQAQIIMIQVIKWLRIILKSMLMKLLTSDMKILQ